MGPTYEGKLEAVEIATEYARDNLSPSNDSLYIFSDCQSAKLAVTSQNRKLSLLHCKRNLRESHGHQSKST